jgi:hypothetical protein
MSEKESSNEKTDYFGEVIIPILGIILIIIPYFIADYRCDKDINIKIINLKATWSIMLNGESSKACQFPVEIDPRKKYPVKERKFENSH